VAVMVKPRQPREARSRTAPDQAHAAGLAGEPADDFGTAAGLAEGAFVEVGVADALPMLARETPVAAGPPYRNDSRLSGHRRGTTFVNT
jgi:hypothetical protein